MKIEDIKPGTIWENENVKFYIYDIKFKKEIHFVWMKTGSSKFTLVGHSGVFFEEDIEHFNFRRIK